MPRLLIVGLRGGVFAFEGRKEMFIGSFILSACSVIFDLSWFIWPFVFVFSLAWEIRDWMKDDCCSAKPLLVADASFMIIEGGMIGMMH